MVDFVYPAVYKTSKKQHNTHCSLFNKASLVDLRNEKYRRKGALSRPLTRWGQWSQTTTGI